MENKNQQLLLSLRFIPFVLTNGMNLFPVLILAQLFLKHRDIDKYVLPLILYFSFKTTVLFLVRLKPVTVNHLLQFAIIIGIIGSFLGSLYELNLYFGLIAGSLIGICSGLLYPSFLTVQFHEKTYNNFSTGKKDQLYSIGFAFVYSLVLFLLLKNSLPLTFFFLGCSLILLLFILRAYPAYEIEEEMEEPSYPVFETLFFFITGFFVIFIIKADKKLGIAESLPIFFVFLGTLLILYLFFVKRTKPERRLTSLQTRMIIYKGMLTNYILVFCTFYQLIKEGGMAINKIYIIYLIAITLAPMIYACLLKKFLENKVTDVIAIGIALGFILMLWSYTFYFGVLVLTIFTSQLNLRLNQLVYTEANLPKDYRLLAKYRLTNVGSILHQLIMMFVMYVGTLLFKNVTIDEILQSYTYKNVDESTFQTMDMTKFVLIAGFLIALFILQKAYNKEKTV
ncbi:MAG: hypothetical protein RR494_01715 [Vagococcus sp.]|uniref:hypothetical protein n=1 Tax=Vagococcus TaxID=2737 RepID=UPI002FCB5CF9